VGKKGEKIMDKIDILKTFKEKGMDGDFTSDELRSAIGLGIYALEENKALKAENDRLHSSIIEISCKGAEGKHRSVPEMRVAMLYKEKEELKAENERLLKAITDGRLRSGHFKAWKEQIRIQQGYDGSELTCLLDRLAEVVFEDKPKEYYQRQLIGDNKPIVNHYDDGDNGCDGQVSGAGSTALTNYKNISEALKEIKRIIKKEK
jgi:hypothetical protein